MLKMELTSTWISVLSSDTDVSIPPKVCIIRIPKMHNKRNNSKFEERSLDMMSPFLPVLRGIRNFCTDYVLYGVLCIFCSRVLQIYTKIMLSGCV